MVGYLLVNYEVERAVHREFAVSVVEYLTGVSFDNVFNLKSINYFIHPTVTSVNVIFGTVEDKRINFNILLDFARHYVVSSVLSFRGTGNLVSTASHINKTACVVGVNVGNYPSRNTNILGVFSVFCKCSIDPTG